MSRCCLPGNLLVLFDWVEEPSTICMVTSGLLML